MILLCVILVTVQKRQIWLQFWLWSTLLLDDSCSNSHRLPFFNHCPNQLHSTCRVQGGWWRTGIFHPLETRRFGTCKLCIGCLWKAYVKVFENCHKTWINFTLRYAPKTQRFVCIAIHLKNHHFSILAVTLTARELEQLMFLLSSSLFLLKISTFLSILFLYVAMFVLVRLFVFSFSFFNITVRQKIAPVARFFLLKLTKSKKLKKLIVRKDNCCR